MSYRILAKAPIPQWFRDLTKDQQEKYLEEHPNSKLSKYISEQKSPVAKKPSPAQDDKKGGTGKSVKKPDTTKNANDLLVKEGSPSNFRGPRSKGDAVGDNSKKERNVVSKLDKLAKMAKDAKEKGKAAPNYNLCEISIPGTNLFCEGNVGIPRQKMPQLKGKPVPGSWAAENLKPNKDGEVDGEKAFEKMLSEKGISQKKKKIDVSKLKASQTELVGAKVAGMYSAVKQAYKNASAAKTDQEKVDALNKVAGITAPIYVSKDGYILDGHHRWASLVGLALADGVPDPVEMDVIEVDMEIKDLIKETNDFANSIGIAQKAAKAENAKMINMFGGCAGGYCPVPLRSNGATMQKSIAKRLERAGNAEVRELELHVENDALADKNIIYIIKMLRKKHLKGVYDYSLAWKAFLPLVQESAKAYAKKHGSGLGVRSIFSKQDEVEVAKRLSDFYRDQVEAVESSSSVKVSNVQRRVETAIFGRKSDRAPKSQQEVIQDENDVDYSVFGIKPDKVNNKLRLEIVMILKTLNKRGRLFNLRKITNVDPSTVCATAIIKNVAGLSALPADIEACGYSNIEQAISSVTKRPVSVYGENELYYLHVDTKINTVTLITK